jgi:3-hydroxybutyryl-CoA dehydrogenase
MSRVPDVIGVVGAGTMGAGIAQLACLAGARTLLHDADPEALHGALERIPAALERGAVRERWSAADASAAARRLEAAGRLEDLAPCGLVIEAAPESLELKRGLFARLARAAPDAVLASNTSSIPITAIAGAVEDPARVVGMHFFNPPPIMRLLEVVAGLESGEDALRTARATGEAMGRHVIDAADGPGFLVNRCNRPFGLEALKLLAERAAPVDAIDRICRLAGRFPMGPFELSDLVGVDVGFAVARSFHEQSFGEPRWRPSPLQAQLVAAGRLGRKSGRGWYAYEGARHRPDDPPPPEPGGGDGRLVVVGGELPLAEELRDLAAAAGWAAVDPLAAEGEVPWLAIDCGAEPGEPPLQGGPMVLLCADGSLHALDPGGGAVGFHALPPLDAGALVELTRTGTTTTVAAERAAAFFTSLGRHVEWVQDAPGLVLGRIVCQLVNEACFAVAEGVGTPQAVDDGMVLGLNHPRGPFAWLEAIGVEHVVAVLDALHVELGEERYRAAPMLRRLAAAAS